MYSFDEPLPTLSVAELAVHIAFINNSLPAENQLKAAPNEGVTGKVEESKGWCRSWMEEESELAW